MSPRHIILNYDEDADVMYVFDERFDKASTMNVMWNADICARMDFDTKKLVGFVIEDFSETHSDFYAKYQSNRFELMEFFDHFFELYNAKNQVIA